MGAWGHGIFDNEDAMDWVNDLVESGDLGPVAAALSSVLETDDELEAADCSAALAAAEVLAAIAGEPSNKLPDEVGAWLQRNRPQADDALLDYALRAVRKIRSQSELRELWEESGEYREWLAVVSDLKSRLS